MLSLPDILILTALGVWLGVVVAFLIKRRLRNKKTGQISCCCSCSSCPMGCKSKK
ncbi:MAG: hypothetical protein IKB47_00630 [Clostridia bacterium]|nr:hypothetical protein [Clostridia bacterium]